MRHLRVGAAVAALFGLSIFLGCQDERATTGPHVHVLGDVQLEPEKPTVEEGGSLELTATPMCEAGHPLDLPVEWSSSDTSVATVNDGGVLTGVYEGGVEIRAEARTEDDAAVTGTQATVERAGTMVEASGGVVSAASGDVLLLLPEGALADATEISIDPSPARMQSGKRGLLHGTAFHLRPDGLQLKEKARLHIRYRDELIGPETNVQRLRLFRHSGDGWTEITDSRVETETRTVSASISGFSHYAVAESELPPVERVVVTCPSTEPLMVGADRELSVTLLDADGNFLDRRVDWRSSNEGVAAVDDTGLVTGMARGSATITAESEGVSGTFVLEVRGSGGGGHEEGPGNNLSYPVVFANGIGLTGEGVTREDGLRPAPEEEAVVDALPFFWDGNGTNYGPYYTQQSENVWQAEWIDGTATDWSQQATVAWGDNVTHHSFDTHSMIRVEHVLHAAGVDPMQGFEMTYLYGQGPDEMQGTDGTLYDAVPTVYSVMPRLKLEKLSGTDPDGQPGDPVCEIFSGAIHEGVGADGHGYYSSEVNVAGKLIYGFNFRIRDVEMCPEVHRYGWWRITFQLDDVGFVGGFPVERMVDLVGIEAGENSEELTYTPEFDPATNTTWLDVYVESGRGGGGGGCGGGGGGDDHSH